MKLTILGCGGTDGRGDWGACDPADPRNLSNLGYDFR